MNRTNGLDEAQSDPSLARSFSLSLLLSLSLTGLHRDAEEAPVVMETAGAEAFQVVTAEIPLGHGRVSAAEEVSLTLEEELYPPSTQLL